MYSILQNCEMDKTKIKFRKVDTREQINENVRFSHNVYTLCITISPCPKISDTENTTQLRKKIIKRSFYK